MSNYAIPHNQTQKKITYLDDGILDLILGVWFLGVALSFAEDIAFLPGIMPAFFVPLIQSFRARLKANRDIPLAQFDLEDHGRKLYMALGIGLVVMLVFLATIFAMANDDFKDFMGDLGLAPVIMLVVGWIAVMGMLLDLNRWYGYAVLLVAFAIVGELLSLTPASISLIFGGAIIGAGIVVLRNYLNTYPAQ